MRDGAIKQLLTEARHRPEIMLVTGDLGFGVLTPFMQHLPEQFLNAGVAEQNMMAVAAGMALEGFQVFAYSIGTFPTMRCYEQIRNDICYHDANVKIICVGAGFSYGQLGMSHFATEDVSIMRALPNMMVISPCDEHEAAAAVSALVRHPGPAYLRIDKSNAKLGPLKEGDFQLGKARHLRDGSDVTLIGCGGLVGELMAAAHALEGEGISARVLGIHTIRPLDTEAICRAALATGTVVVIEEHTVVGGLGSAVAETLLDEGLGSIRLKRLGISDQFPSIVGDQSYLRAAFGLDAAGIANAVRGLFQQPARPELLSC